MTNIHHFSDVFPITAKVIGLSIALLIVLTATGLHAEGLSPEYLYGRWVVNLQNCSSADAEYIVFGKNRTFESSRSGKTEIIGFWEINDEVLDLHMVTSPASFADISGDLIGYDGLYYYFKARLVVHNIQKDRFEAIGVLGEEVDRGYAVRCK